MHAVKYEKPYIHPSEQSSPNHSAYTSSSPNDCIHHSRQYVLDRTARIISDASPYKVHRRGEPTHPRPLNLNSETYRHRERIEHMEGRGRELARTPDGPVGKLTLTHAVREASHEILLATGNSAYARALQNLARAQREVAEYYEQNAQFSATLDSVRTAYQNLAGQYRVALGQVEQCLQRHHQAQQLVDQATLFSEETTDTKDTLAHLLTDETGPIVQPEGLKLYSLTGPWYTTPETRPSHLPFEVFWQKSDWSEKRYPNWSFVRDRYGVYLGHLMRGIRDTTRKIWNELCSGGYRIQKSFNKNDYEFKKTYVATIEEIYPCLKLCEGHWKALQVGIKTYPNWYASYSKKKGAAGNIREIKEEESTQSSL